MRVITEEFLLEIFALCLRDNNYFHTVKQYLKSNYILDEDYRRAWDYLVKYQVEKKTRPSVGTLIQRLTDDNTKGKNDGVIAVFMEVKITIITNPDKILKEFEEFLIQNKFMELYSTTGKLFNDGKKDEAYAMFKRGADDIHDFTLSGASFNKVFGDFFERMSERLTPCEREPIQIPTGWLEIDHSTDGGLYTGETELWLGDSGVGKSKMLVGRSVQTARAGYDVLHIQAEGTKRQCLDNFDACWTGQVYSDLKKGKFNDAKIQAYTKVIKTISGEVFVKSFEQFGKINTAMIRGWLMELLKQGRDIKHLVVDYMDLVEPTTDYEAKFGSGADGERLRQMEVVRQLKNIATEFNILVTTATQSSDIPTELTEQEAFVITRNFLGNAKRKVEPFSYFFTINQTPEERKKQIVRVHAEKFRDYEAHKTFKFKQNLKSSRFYCPQGTANLRLFDADEMEEEAQDKKKKGTKVKDAA